jgi:hypothetical protein
VKGAKAGGGDEDGRGDARASTSFLDGPDKIANTKAPTFHTTFQTLLEKTATTTKARTTKVSEFVCVCVCVCVGGGRGEVRGLGVKCVCV